MRGGNFYLTPISWLFQAGVHLRHFLYDKKIFSKKFAPLPVISIGNVVAGGSGKTQVALLLAEALEQEISVAILSRGYRGLAEHAKEPLVVDISRHSPSVCGDEPWLLASRLKSTPIIVNKNRFKSALRAEKLGAKLLVLDDGMQHRKLHRDFEIVVIDGKAAFGHFLPKGNLREDVQRLKMADLILFVGEVEESLEKKIASLTQAPQVVAKIAPCGLFQLNGEPIDSIKGKKVALFCGIGNPSRFVKTVEEMGAQVALAHFSADHCLMKQKQMQKFVTLAMQRGANLLLCTEKDKVKLTNERLPLAIGWIKTHLEIVKNSKGWTKTIDEIKTLAGKGL